MYAYFCGPFAFFEMMGPDHAAVICSGSDLPVYTCGMFTRAHVHSGKFLLCECFKGEVFAVGCELKLLKKTK